MFYLKVNLIQLYLYYYKTKSVCVGGGGQLSNITQFYTFVCWK